ncbi:hypothetical protein Z664_00240 [Coxiella endosymbiont of Amblyomma americanum]|nr:hypothetical protein Z664_00240 [Coxiella endosymbiont of Amblyomma americanum]
MVFLCLLGFLCSLFIAVFWNQINGSLFIGKHQYGYGPILLEWHAFLILVILVEVKRLFLLGGILLSLLYFVFLFYG